MRQLLVVVVVAGCARAPAPVTATTPPAAATPEVTANDDLAEFIAPPEPPRPPPPAPVGDGSPRDLDKGEIRRAIRQHMSSIAACYEQQREAVVDRLVIDFFIAHDGTVTRSAASGIAPAVGRCVADVIKRIKFPALKEAGGVEVSYPFSFRTA
jgi:hypothetical protein